MPERSDGRRAEAGGMMIAPIVPRIFARFPVNVFLYMITYCAEWYMRRRLAMFLLGQDSLWNDIAAEA